MLGGFIGPGGHGEPIFTSIRKDSPALLLEGAIPQVPKGAAVEDRAVGVSAAQAPQNRPTAGSRSP